MTPLIVITLLTLSVKGEIFIDSDQQNQLKHSREIEAPGNRLFSKTFQNQTNDFGMARILNREMIENVPEKLTPRRNDQDLIQEISEDLNTLWNRAIIILLDDTQQVHRNAEMFITELVDSFHQEFDFGLMKFNNSGVTPVLANTLSNKELYLRLLKWKENSEVLETSKVLGPETTQGGAAFFGIVKAARILPENSGIIIFTDRGVEDEDLTQLAMKEVLRKRIRLYVVWTSPYLTQKHQEKLLREAALLTGGNFYVATKKSGLSELYSSVYYENPDSKQTKAVIAFYNVTESKQLHFPINSDVTNIHISISSSVIDVRLNSPQAYTINLLNSTEVEHFSRGSFSVLEIKPSRYEIQLNTLGKIPTLIAGVWRLDVDPGAQSCSVTISVQTHLNVTTYITDVYDNNASNDVESLKPRKVLRVSIARGLGNIENITLLNDEGIPINQNIAFNSQDVKRKPSEDVEEIDNTNREVDIELNSLPKGPFYLKIHGEDQEGVGFSRLSYFDREKINYVFQPISIEVGAGSELLVMPNQQGKIYFEVTNNRDQVMYVYFMVQDRRSYLARMEPRASWLNPKQTVIVTVTTYIPNVAGTNTMDVITFTVSGPETVQKSAAMYVGTNRITDNEEPRMTHRYTSDCTNILLGDCQGGTWVIEVTAEDRESGLLQLTSNPKGLYFPNNFMAGTKESVIGIYGGSCCQPKIQLTAIDMQNNRRTYTADAYFATLSAGSIAAIVLGLILLILVIVAIVLLCRKRCCPKKESVDLPTYRSPHGNTQTRY